VVVNGAGNVSFLSNAGFSSVSEPSPGKYCLTPAYAGHPILVSSAGTGQTIAVIGAAQCPGGYELEAAEAPLSSGQGFIVSVP
jgi:hypothetical protein